MDDSLTVSVHGHLAHSLCNLHWRFQDVAHPLLPQAIAAALVEVERILHPLSRGRVQHLNILRHHLWLSTFQQALGCESDRGKLCKPTSDLYLHCSSRYRVGSCVVGDAHADDYALADASEAKGWTGSAVWDWICVST